MSAPDEFPESDRAGDAPHPRETAALFGQSAAEAAFLDAYASGRLHHGWLITGPKGVGKATLAWSIARFLLATPPVDDDGLFGAPPPPTSLAISPDHPVARRMRALSDPGLFLLRRPWDEKASRHKAQITVDEVRRLHGFFALSSADGGRRVVIVDAADEMNVQAANALLKMLEEPPARTTLLLIAHQPARLLPTIRSRCRELRLSPLSPDAMRDALLQAGATVPEGANAAALAELAGGSAGEALRLLELDGLKLYRMLLAFAARFPAMDRASALALADLASAGRAAEARTELLFQLVERLMARAARAGATGQPPAVELAQGEGAVLARLASSPAQGRAWAETAQRISARAAHGRAVNIDAGQLMLDALLAMQSTAA